MKKLERHALAEQMFQDALAIRPDERAAFLASNCGDDLELRHEVESLISADDQARGFLSSPPIQTAATLILDQQSEPMSGRSFGHYQILDLLGKGGMGEVYRARDTRLARDVAIKFVPQNVADDENKLRRLEREARMLASLNHPNIATIHGLEYFGESRLVVMELVPGETLDHVIARGPMPVEQALSIFRQIAEALEAAHAKGVIHRDLKPANVKLSRDGKVKLLDFGLAKNLDPSGTNNAYGPGSIASLTSSGVIVGTPAYMSPEQARGEPLSKRTDIWAFGALLYEALSGERAFGGASLAEIFGNILHRAPYWPRLSADIPSTLGSLLRQCLEKDPAARPQNMAEVLIVIQEVIATPSGSVAELHPSRGLRRLAVLPLQDLSGDAEQDYFVEGTHDALITELARLGGLRVIARRSVMRYKGTQTPLSEIANELKVEAVLTGSVVRSGDRVRITAQLINTETEEHLWAGRYERNLRDVLGLQNDIVTAIVREIRLQLTPQEEARLASTRPINPEAYEAYLKGRFHWHRLSREHLDTALSYFQLALDKDPNYALAHAGIACVWCSRGDTGVIPPHEAFSKGKAAALKAIELDDRLAEVRAILANVRFCHEWDWGEAEREFVRAIDLNPNYADARMFYADFLISFKRFEEAIGEIQRALELDPLNYFIQCFFGWHLVYLARYEEAIAELRQAISREPNFAAAHLGLWGALYQEGTYQEALEAAKKFFAVLDDAEIGEALARGAEEGGYEAAMRLAASKLATRAQLTYVPAIRVARLYAHAGEKERALEWLEKAFEKREPALVHLSVGWDWQSLRGHSRFQTLLRRMNLPE